jgi:hypothetical protein
MTQVSPENHILDRLGRDPYEALHQLAWLLASTGGAVEWTRRLAATPVTGEGAEWIRRLALLGAATRGDLGALAALRAQATPGPWPKGAVCIVVGTTDDEEDLGGVETALSRAFAGADGVVISGGTRAGVAGLVGSWGAASKPRLTTIGYVPAGAAEVNPQYDLIRRTSGADYSPLEALQAWTDLLVAGVQPESVRVLGVGGGRISGAEYRIALALGAWVGILTDAGRSGLHLLQHSRWSGCPRLRSLPTSAAAMEQFLRGEQAAR